MKECVVFATFIATVIALILHITDLSSISYDNFNRFFVVSGLIWVASFVCCVRI